MVPPFVLSLRLDYSDWISVVRTVTLPDCLLFSPMPDGHRALTLSLVFWVGPDYFHDCWLWVLHLSHHISSVTTAGEVTNRFSLGSSSQKLTFYLPDVPPFDMSAFGS